MLLTEYLSDLVRVIDEYSQTGLIIDSELSTDFRTEKIGIIKGSISFSDNSKLIFNEYLDLRYRIEKLNYSFHYQKQNDSLILRYDNAMHKPSVESSGHKHISNGKIIPATHPALKEVLAEIMDLLL